MSEKGKLNSGLGVGAVFNQVQKTVDSKEYLVEGAKLMCVNGSCVTQLKLPKNHNYTSGGKQKVNCKDCKACVNIPYFGECKKNENTHQCEGFMDLVEKWENTAVSATKAEIVGGEEAISMSSVLLGCLPEALSERGPLGLWEKYALPCLWQGSNQYEYG